jgi:hypothetical protein
MVHLDVEGMSSKTFELHIMQVLYKLIGNATMSSSICHYKFVFIVLATALTFIVGQAHLDSAGAKETSQSLQECALLTCR